jgi:hypothetical protein
MLTSDETLERAQESIVFALLRRPQVEEAPMTKFPRIESRPPRPVSNQPNLDAALDEVMARFPKALDYLAK